jgi:hypothetical protein
MASTGMIEIRTGLRLNRTEPSRRIRKTMGRLEMICSTDKFYKNCSFLVAAVSVCVI